MPIPIGMLFLAGMVLFLAVALPQKVSAGSHDFQIWTPVYLTVNFTDNIQGWYEAQPRFCDDVSQVNQLLLRTAGVLSQVQLPGRNLVLLSRTKHSAFPQKC